MGTNLVTCVLGKASDEVADVLLTFLTEHNKILPFLKLLIDREVFGVVASLELVLAVIFFFLCF